MYFCGEKVGCDSEAAGQSDVTGKADRTDVGHTAAAATGPDTANTTGGGQAVQL